MAELVFSQVGASIGARALPQGVSILGRQIAGAEIGRQIGGFAGSALTSYLFSPRIEGPRVKELYVSESREGAAAPVVYGRMRVGGQVIWAARFKETRNESGGGKGGPKVTEYSYSLSFAVGICAGPIADVSRIWANGEPLDLASINWRYYAGDETQAPDPLIEAIEGAGQAPAYRGLAYAVFEDLPLDAYGARLPQLSFEVLRRPGAGGGRLEDLVGAVNIIPGAGEFAYATDVVKRVVSAGVETSENAHTSNARSDFLTSLDQLQAELPNVSHVNLVVGWFGDDLRASQCQIRPGVEISEKETRPLTWRVAGQSRGSAYLVSTDDEGRPAYGGSPDDESVRQAITALKARGFSVTLYPFVFMDVAPGNGLPDPYGGAEQAAYPWRGRITSDIAPDLPGTTDKTAAISGDISAFFGDAAASDFSVSAGVVSYSGANDWRFRRFILHYAALGASAGLNGFLIGSEMPGLTRLRSASGVYPATAELQALAAEARTLLGAGVEISYAADWTEYGSHAPADGSGDVHFPLDPLWADANIDFVGVDWYPPMADWREGSGHVDALAGYSDQHDLSYLAANIEGGEAYDWYYANVGDRAAQGRTPIIDSAHGEDWVFRQKDIKSWWAAAHHDRPGGVRNSSPTAWTPEMKPVRFVEIGCPAVDKGANQPNVFYDPKSAESALPHYSDGGRDDLIQRRAIEAFVGYWDLSQGANPPSSVYSGAMTDPQQAGVWAWDARPYPAFPVREDVWSDGGNWRLGHWLNGRAGLALLSDVVADICAQAGGLLVDASGLGGVVTGYGFDGPVSARDVLEPLRSAYGFDAVERDGVLTFALRSPTAIDLSLEDLESPQTGGAINWRRSRLETAPSALRLSFIDTEADFQPGLESADGEPGGPALDISLPIAMDRDSAVRRARELVKEEQAATTGASFTLSPAALAFEPGDLALIEGEACRLKDVSDGVRRRADAVGTNGVASAVLATSLARAPIEARLDTVPDVVLVDSPPLPGEEDDARPLAFAFGEPWTAPVRIWAGPDAANLTLRGEAEAPAVIGRLATALPAGPIGRWVDASFDVDIVGGDLAAREDIAVLNGANAALVETLAGWELIQFQNAQLISTGRYRLSKLLRGQQGSDLAADVGANASSRILFLTGAETRVDVSVVEAGLSLAWRASPSSALATDVWTGNFTSTPINTRAWRPAHLSATLAGDDWTLNWIRRARVGGDPWGAGEPPILIPESYSVEVRDDAGALLRSWSATTTSSVYAFADTQIDFPTGGTAQIRVAQIGADGLSGPYAQTMIAL
ncbi:MAG: glycoside hydrolase/phage tail family protein [Pseudomonadota bacterium]